MKHILTILVNDKPGVVSRVAALFTKRNYNIDSLITCSTDKEGTTDLIIVVNGEDAIIEQISKQLNKLIDVIAVNNITAKKYVSRELALIKVRSDADKRSEIIQIVDVFRASIVDLQKDSMIIEATGNDEKIEALIEALRPYGILDLDKTGEIAMARKISNR